MKDNLVKFENKYRKKLKEVLNDDSINKYNRQLFQDFFTWQEDKLEHGSDTGRLGIGNYKTLYDYISKLKNVNKWVDNRAWNTLTEKDIRELRRDLISGKITNKRGEPYSDIRSYVNKIFKYKPFKLAGLNDIVNNVFEFAVKSKKKDVRFVSPSSAKKMIMSAKNYEHKALLCLAWDIGENIDSLLKLKWKWVKKFVDDETKKEKYSVYLPDEILKESRTSRTEITLFNDTVETLNQLKELGKPVQERDSTGKFTTAKLGRIPYEEDDLIFNFEYGRAVRIFSEYVKKTGITCEPNGEKPTWKDFRSGMACNLFDMGWSAEDVNLRLGHSALSTQFNVYVNYKGLNRKQAVRKHDKITLKVVEEKLEESEMARQRQEIRHNKEIEELRKKQIESDKKMDKLIKNIENITRAIK